MKPMKIKFISILTLGMLLSISISQPANAFNINIQDTIKGFLKEVGVSEKVIDNYLKDVVGIFPGDVAGKAKGNKGDLKLPDIDKTEKDITAEFTNNKNLEDLDIAHDLLTIGVTKSHSQGVTGEDGQKNILKAKEDVKKSVQQTESLATTANNAQVTQEVMKNIATQNQQIANVLGKSHSSLEDLRLTSAYNNQINAKRLEKEINQNEQEIANTVNTNLAGSAVMGEFAKYVLNQ